MARGSQRVSVAVPKRTLGALLLPVRGMGEAYGQVRSLLKVSASRAGVLCPTCHSKNDDGYHFCQWCGNTVSAHYRQVDGKGPQASTKSRSRVSFKSRSHTYRGHSTQGRSGISVLARFMWDQATDGGTCSPLLRCWYKRPDRMLIKSRGMKPEVRT